MRMLVSALLLFSCAAVAAGDEFQLPLGKPYVGGVTTQVQIAGGEGASKRNSGTAIAEFVKIDEKRSRFELKATILRRNDSGLTVEGESEEPGWVGYGDSMTFLIEPDGVISGGGVDKQHRIAFAGHVSEHDLNLTITTQRLVGAGAGNSAAGTKVVFEYSLQREASSASEPASKRTQKKAGRECKRIVWKARNVTTPGGGMQMIQVPHCVK